MSAEPAGPHQGGGPAFPVRINEATVFLGLSSRAAVAALIHAGALAGSQVAIGDPAGTELALQEADRLLELIRNTPET